MSSRARPNSRCRAFSASSARSTSLEGLVDKAAEAKRVAAELAKTQGFIKSIDAKLGNANFVAHAPAAIVEGQKAKRAELEAKIAQLEKLAKLFAV